MVLNSKIEEWVAFDEENTCTSGFEVEFPPSPVSFHQNGRGFGKSVRKKSSKDDTQSVATWMKKPINSDASWAPMAPPKPHMERNEEHPVRAQKRRPPAVARHSSSDDSNPVSSSSESSASERQPRSTSRPRSSKRSESKPTPIAVAVPVLKAPPQKPLLSPKGRGRSRVTDSSSVGHARQQPIVTVQRGRSVSQTRQSRRERSSSASRRSVQTTTRVETKMRSRDRPPVTSPRMVANSGRSGRSRSTSRARIPRARSTSRTRQAAAPPNTLRTRREMRNPAHGYSSVGAPISSSNSNADDRSARSSDPNIGRDISFGRTQSAAANKSSLESPKKRSQIMEKFFGDQVSNDATGLRCVSTQKSELIHSRILLTATVYHNTATNLWIATINTNQKGVAKNPTKASRYLKAFSFSTEKEARESAIANAPPKMLRFDDHSTCHVCKGKFAVFRRACHCRNCGVCICSACSTSWPAKAIPETYNLKKESQVKVCKSCNFLSSAFKKALLEGDYEEAIAVYGSGNINLRTPFPQFSNKKKEEVMYPIHCAVEGGNLSIVRWLMEDHFCPVKVIRTGGGSKKSKKGGDQDYPILTSKSRSVLTIAMDNVHVHVLRYLVVDNGFSIYESKDLKGSLRALEAVLAALPSGMGEYRSDGFSHRWDDAVYEEGLSVASSLGADGTFPGSEYDESSISRLSFRSSVNHNDADACIICCENKIDCVITPCGHQVNCLSCSKNLKACPVCNNRGEFIKVYRP
mmetsp:Transcript_20809/g.51598  ORF Transcript_20809/g.51598 Transcript_20809/m.51598 type:complete len:749 (-) Transcript_20809:211-2457(-)